MGALVFLLDIILHLSNPADKAIIDNSQRRARVLVLKGTDEDSSPLICYHLAKG
jgi:hypothetical protein